MLQHKSILNVADNTGAHTMMIIHTFGGSTRKFAYIGDLVNCIIKKADPNSLVKDGERVLAVIVRTRKGQHRKDGSYIRFDDNAGVILDTKENKNPKGTRIFGPVSREIKELGFNKIASLAKEVW